MVQLYKDDAFMLAVRERWDEVKDDLMARAREAVAHYSALTADSRDRYNEAQNRHASEAEVQYVLDYLEARYAWIDASIHEENFNRKAYEEDHDPIPEWAPKESEGADETAEEPVEGEPVGAEGAE